MNTFTIITGLIGTFLGFLGFKNTLPEYSNYLIYLSFICIGLFIGLIISLFDKRVNIKVYNISSLHIFVYIFYLGIFIISIILLLLYPTSFLQIIGGIGFFTFFSFSHVLSLVRKDGITISERKILADKYENEGNYSGALGHYYEMIDGMKEEDERYNGLKEKITEIRKKQIL